MRNIDINEPYIREDSPSVLDGRNELQNALGSAPMLMIADHISNAALARFATTDRNLRAFVRNHPQLDERVFSEGYMRGELDLHADVENMFDTYKEMISDLKILLEEREPGEHEPLRGNLHFARQIVNQWEGKSEKENLEALFDDIAGRDQHARGAALATFNELLAIVEELKKHILDINVRPIIL